jgi:hypothetical protein
VGAHPELDRELPDRRHPLSGLDHALYDLEPDLLDDLVGDRVPIARIEPASQALC